MSKRIFTQEHIEELLKNKYVVRCSEKSITYHKDFKLLAVKQYQDDGLSAYQIFKEAGFNVDMIGRDTPKESVRRWKKIFKKEGGFEERRGENGKKRKVMAKNLTDSEKISQLEMKVAYLKAENSFLVKLRAKRKG